MPQAGFTEQIGFDQREEMRRRGAQKKMKFRISGNSLANFALWFRSSQYTTFSVDSFFEPTILRKDVDRPNLAGEGFCAARAYVPNTCERNSNWFDMLLERLILCLRMDRNFSTGGRSTSLSAPLKPLSRAPGILSALSADSPDRNESVKCCA